MAWVPEILGLVSTRVLVTVLITDTLLLPALATYSRPSAPSARLEGWLPTVMVLVTLLVLVLITDTVLLPRLATYSRPCR